MKITDFKIGDIVTRNEPALLSPATGLSSVLFFKPAVYDHSYIGDPLLIQDIKNGCLYYQYLELKTIKGKIELSYSRIFGENLMSLPLNRFMDGWEAFVMPEIKKDKRVKK
jgi:hypothetical protein